MHEIRLYGPIGGAFGYSALEIMSQVPADAEDITLRIHSPGGSVGEGLAIYNALKDHPARVTTVVDGYSASIASVIMLAGDVRQVHPSSMVYIHKPWSQATGNADDMRKAADDLDKHETAINEIYAARTGHTVEALQDMLRTEEFFVGSEAVEMGFADSVIDDPAAELEVAALLDFAANIEDKKAMSKQKTRKDIEAELVAAADQITALQATIDDTATAADADIDSAKAELQTVIDEHAATIEARTNELAEAHADIAKLTDDANEAAAKIEKLNAAATEVAADLDAKTAEIEAHAATIESLTKRIEDPAYVDAKLEDIDAEIAPDVDAEADASEQAAQAQSEDEPVAFADVAAEWDSMEAGADRQAFWATNKREILACLEARTDD